MTTKQKDPTPLVAAILCSIAAGGLWYWHLHDARFSELPLKTITGTVKSLEEHRVSRGDSFLEFYIAESPARLRLSYRQAFGRNAFFANVKPGSRIDITAKADQWLNPGHALLDPVDTIWVYGLKDDKMIYCSPNNWNELAERNTFIRLLMATVVSLGAAVFAIRYMVAVPEDIRAAYRRGRPIVYLLVGLPILVFGGLGFIIALFYAYSHLTKAPRPVPNLNGFLIGLPAFFLWIPMRFLIGNTLFYFIPPLRRKADRFAADAGRPGFIEAQKGILKLLFIFALICVPLILLGFVL